MGKVISGGQTTPISARLYDVRVSNVPEMYQNGVIDLILSEPLAQDF